MPQLATKMRLAYGRRTLAAFKNLDSLQSRK